VIMVTLNQINHALAARGVAERLVRGKGYFYFWEGDAPRWRNSCVMVFRLNAFTLDQWLAEYDQLKSAQAALE